MKLLAWFQIIALAFLFCASTARGEPSGGNHVAAKSESWTWGGQLWTISAGKLGASGLGFLCYYVRNDARDETGKVGQINFRSTTRTTNKNAIGTGFSTNTIYTARHADSWLRTRAGRLSLEFSPGRGAAHDIIYEAAMTEQDASSLQTALRYFPGLSVAPGFTPSKTKFHVIEVDGSVTDLTFYSIWPKLMPASGRMKFLGQRSTFSYSEPMLVSVGTYRGNPVAGLSFLDRQWAPEYFGQNMLHGLGSLMRTGEALNFAHSWAAFHARNARTGEYSFFHLWNQWRRTPGQADQQVEYSGLLYARNGTEYGDLPSSEVHWSSSGYVQALPRHVLLKYSAGRYGFFPSVATLHVPKIGLNVRLIASPSLQTLDQPIDFYEGYAAGKGSWSGDPISVFGRIESSRLLFRSQDYQQMLATEGKSALGNWLREALAKRDGSGPFSAIRARILALLSQLDDLGLKIALLREGLSASAPYADSRDPGVMIYH